MTKKALLNIRYCVNCGELLASRNTSGQCYRYCENPAEEPVAEHAIESEVVLRAAYLHFNADKEAVWVTAQTSLLMHQRRVILYLLKLDSRLGDSRMKPYTGRDHTAVRAAVGAVAGKLSDYTKDIKAIRELYNKLQAG
ncbi:MAG: hypothetical protein Q7R71_02465 [bacterium]|nr:hypothetical protein [bacterium]